MASSFFRSNLPRSSCSTVVFSMSTPSSCDQEALVDEHVELAALRIAVPALPRGVVAHLHGALVACRRFLLVSVRDEQGERGDVGLVQAAVGDRRLHARRPPRVLGMGLGNADGLDRLQALDRTALPALDCGKQRLEHLDLDRFDRSLRRRRRPGRLRRAWPCLSAAGRWARRRTPPFRPSPRRAEPSAPRLSSRTPWHPHAPAVRSERAPRIVPDMRALGNGMRRTSQGCHRIAANFPTRRPV